MTRIPHHTTPANRDLSTPFEIGKVYAYTWNEQVVLVEVTDLFYRGEDGEDTTIPSIKLALFKEHRFSEIGAEVAFIDIVRIDESNLDIRRPDSQIIDGNQLSRFVELG